MSINDVKYQAYQIRSTLWSAQNWHNDLSRSFAWALDSELAKELKAQNYQVIYGPPNAGWP